MALTISTQPSEVVTNAPLFTVTTSLTESASYQNLRIRATVYMGGETEAVAVLEQPKGIDDWDFTDLLKSLCGRCNVAVGGSDHFVHPTVGSQLITGFTNLFGNYETFTSSANEITSAIDTDASGGAAHSQDIGAVAVGDTYVMIVHNDYTLNSGGPVNMGFTDTSFNTISSVYNAGCDSDGIQANHVYFAVASEADTGSYFSTIHANGDNANYAGTFGLYKITDFKGNPGVYFKIVFAEYYENSSDVTTEGDVEFSESMLFMPVTVPIGEAFSDYLLTTSGKKMLTKGEVDHPYTGYSDALTYKYGIGMEIRTLVAGTFAFGKATAVVDAGTSTDTDIVWCGWGMFILGDGTFDSAIDAQDTTIVITMISVVLGGSNIFVGASFTIPCDTKCYNDSIAIGFLGGLGEETLLFRGLHTTTGSGDKTYYKDYNRVRKVLATYKMTRQKLRTLYESETVMQLLHELLYSWQVAWMYNSDFTDGYREVTPIDDSVVINDREELLEPEIEVEYYE